MNIGARIKELRNLVKISHEELAYKIKVSRGNVGDCERGRAKPGAEALLLLSRFFNVSVDWILTGEMLQNTDLFSQSCGKEISPRDLELLAKFHQLAPRDQIKVEGFIEGLLYSQTLSSNGKESTGRANEGA